MTPRKPRSEPIVLTATPSDRLVKRGARATFKALRVLADRARTVPGILAQAATDVRDAWTESADVAHPNA